jgi:hypothetical protein
VTEAERLPIASPPGRRHRRLIFLAVVLVVWSLDTHGSPAGTGDEPHYQMIAHSIVFDGDLDLANDYADRHNLVGGGTLQPERHALVGPDGRLRPVHDIGLPIVAAPAFALAYRAAEFLGATIPSSLLARARLNPPLILRHLLSLAMILVTAVLAIRLYGLLAQDAARTGLALGWTLLFALSPPILSHAFLFYTEIPAALIVLAASSRLSRAKAARDPQAMMWTAFGVGAGAGFLPILHARYLGLTVGLAALCVLHTHRETRRLRTWCALAVPLVVGAAVRIWLNWHLWGTLFTTPHVHVDPFGGIRQTLTVVASRLLAWLFDQEHGLLAYAPIYLLALPGLLVLWRTERREFRDLMIVAGCYVLPMSLPTINPHGWNGGWSPAARFLLPIAPLLACAAHALAKSAGRWPLALKGLVALQVALNVVYWSHPRVLWNAGTGHSALLQRLSPWGIDVGRWFPSWENPTTYSVILSVAALVVWVAGSAIVARHYTRQAGRA